MEELGDLKIKCLVSLLLVEFCDLALDLLHDLDFALEQFSERDVGIVAGLGNFTAAQRLLLLPDFVDQAASDLLFCAWDDEVEELLV